MWTVYTCARCGCVAICTVRVVRVMEENDRRNRAADSRQQQRTRNRKNDDRGATTMSVSPTRKCIILLYHARSVFKFILIHLSTRINTCRCALLAASISTQAFFCRARERRATCYTVLIKIFHRMNSKRPSWFFLIALLLFHRFSLNLAARMQFISVHLWFCNLTHRCSVVQGLRLCVLCVVKQRLFYGICKYNIIKSVIRRSHRNGNHSLNKLRTYKEKITLLLRIMVNLNTCSEAAVILTWTAKCSV